MKKIFILLSALFALVVGVGFLSCSNGDNDSGSSGGNSESKTTVIATSIDGMKGKVFLWNDDDPWSDGSNSGEQKEYVVFTNETESNGALKGFMYYYHYTKNWETISGFNAENEKEEITYKDGSVCYEGGKSKKICISGGKYYRYRSPDDIYTRQSGDGLNSSFSDDDEHGWTFTTKTNGTISLLDKSDSTEICNGTFTNNNGVLTCSFTINGEAWQTTLLYTGDKLYEVEEIKELSALPAYGE
ncbi:MAG: hypothetical protein IJJ71_10670 [Treponema sp.]|uniref:hypothetical protein n=1 Tax=Treponema sp. TaxID=166 RepID=UPI0025ED9C96|nr:hypothetical protein [Treponema sp.]MBR0496624.1 hypothetical protein [Treponema sp.]